MRCGLEMIAARQPAQPCRQDDSTFLAQYLPLQGG